MLTFNEFWLLPHDPRNQLGYLANLLADLPAVGCTDIPGAAQFLRVRNLQPTATPPVEAFPSVLDADPAELQAWARNAALDLATHQKAAAHLGIARERASLELIEIMRSNADSIIDQMRPRFDQAAAAGRHVIALGVRPEFTAEQVMELGEDASRAWLEFKNRHVHTLTRIANARIALSTVCGVPPYNNGAGPVRKLNFGPAFHASIEFPRDRNVREPAHVWWLKLVDELCLAPVEYDDLTNLRALGISTERIEAAAADRKNFLSKDEDEDDGEDVYLEEEPELNTNHDKEA